jgi:YD repeat-containing protein
MKFVILGALALTTVAAPAIAQQLNGAALNVIDLEKERAFYEAAFGMKVAGRIPETGNLQEYLMNWTGVRENRPLIVLNKTAVAHKDGDREPGRLIIGVDDAVAVGRKAVAAGAKAQREIRDGAAYTFVYDPEGNLIEIFDLTPPPRPAAPARPAPAAK